MFNVMCAEHNSEYEVSLNGVYVERLDGSEEPYQLFRGDLLRCVKGHESIYLLAECPFAEHYQKDYEKYAERAANR